jgi:hypothetical protein
MNRPFKRLVVVILVAFLSACTPVRDGPLAEHVLLISIDGWGTDWYAVIREDPERYPTLFGLLAEGSQAERMSGVFPTLTYPSHATIVTGAWPTQHGIPTNYDEQGNWVLQSNRLMVSPIWEMASDRSLSVALVNWPVSHGAEVEYLIPQNLDFHATDLVEQVRRHSTPGLFDTLEAATGEVVMLPFLHHEAGYHLDAMTGRFAAELIRRHRPRLLLAHFLDLDHRQHVDGPLAKDARLALSRIDGWIGEILAAVSDVQLAASTAIVVVGDHGFAGVSRSICVPRLLAEAGLPSPSGDASDGASLQLWMARASIALRADPALHARERLADAIAAHLPDVVTLLDRNELDALHAFPDADLALVAETGYIFATSSCEELIGPSGIFRGAHGYLPDNPAMAAGFVAAGSGIRSGHSFPEMRMVDVAPTVARLLGIRFEAPAGRVIEEILSADGR